MANEFKVKKGLIVDGSGTVVDIQGTQGQLFSVTDSLTGDLFSVSDISGVPILNVNSSGSVEVDGNLGINATPTTNAIEIDGADGTSYIYLKSSAATTGARIGLNSDDLIIENKQASGDMIFDTNSTERLRIASGGGTTFAGNVTLGSASPVLKIDASSTGYPEIFFARLTGDDQNSKIRLLDNQLTFENEGDANSKFLFQGRAASSGSLSDFLKIEGTGITTLGGTFSGDVQIGTTTNKKQLTVYGGNDDGIWVDSQGAQYTSVAWGNNGTEKANVAWDNTNTNFALTAYGSGSSMTMSTGGSATLTLDSSSNATFAGAATFSGVLSLTDGSAGAPAISNTGDANTGMYWPGDHQVGFTVNNSRKFYIAETKAYFQNLSSGVEINAGGIDVTGDSTFAGNVRLNDNVQLQIGSSNDAYITHNGTNTYFVNGVGNLEITQDTNDGDIIFKSDDGLNGTTEYFRVDGGESKTIFTRDLKFLDSGLPSRKAIFGTGNDLAIYHNATDSFIDNSTGNLYIRNNENDKDVYFQNDNGSGGLANYFYLDGGIAKTVFSRDAQFLDNAKALFGNSYDLQIYHDGSNNYIQGVTGDMYIQNGANDKDIIFRSDDGSGGQTEYFKLDGTNVRTLVSKTINLIDSVPLQFGNSQDLRIYHNGSNSYIQDAGTGSLKILAQNFDLTNAAESALMIRAIDGAQVELYYGGAKKFETINTGVALGGNLQFVGAGVGNCGTRYITYNCPDDAEYNVIGIAPGSISVTGNIAVTGTTDGVDLSEYPTLPNQLTYQTLVAHFSQSTGSSSTFNIPMNNTTESTTATYYHVWTPPFNGQVKTMIMKHAHGSSPSLVSSTPTKFRVAVNGTGADYTSSSFLTRVRVEGRSDDYYSYVKDDNINQAFSAGDRVYFQFLNSSSSVLWRNCSVSIVVEYNIT